MPTPADLAKANTEHSHQRALFAWANMAARLGFEAAWDERSYVEPGYAERTYNVVDQLERNGKAQRIPALTRLHAIANGGKRDKITAGKLKAEGVKRGVPDIFLPVPILMPNAAIRYCGLYVEMKRPKTSDQRAGSTSDDQDGWIGYLRSVGYAVSVCFTWDQAAKEIQSYIEAGGSNAVRSS